MEGFDNLPHILVRGDPIEGFWFVGPFPTLDSAMNYVDENKMIEVWPAPLQAPEEE